VSEGAGGELRGIISLISELSNKLDNVIKSIEELRNEVNRLRDAVSKLNEVVEDLAEEVKSLGLGRSAIADEIFKERLKRIIKGFLREESLEI